MTTGSVLAADLLLAILTAAGWLGGGAAAATGHRRVATGLALAGLVTALGRTVTTVVLARAGWWFAAEKVVIATPLYLAAVVVGGRRSVMALFFAGHAATGALLVTVLHGYPVSAGAALLTVAGIAAAGAVTWRLVHHRTSRSGIAVAVVALVAGTGFAVAPEAAPPVDHDHRPTAAPDVGEPTRRFTLTAARAGRAWAFNGQVPGPQITATVGDVLEVTLRNRDIDRGVTLHWHGYDVPNDQDGVPGVTQDAVRPGQEFVYRFRADQAGTYWYHTHSASDVGVRKGLYGALVVRPGPPTGVEVVVTLPPPPAPTTAAVEPGTPVRLRLINTDSTTHRYAVAGAPFRVVAIDGVDLAGPAPLRETTLLIPAGGRYDVVSTAPVALFVDGRLAYANGPAPSTPGAWPVLDPLAYGAAAPAPWTGIDRSLSLVLDRALDLRGLLPRYAHTVNGAADPGIPTQVVRRGEVVKLTVVNRSLVVHPWHLHGHHVLVLSRNGRPATGSPLWLDSFDVLPGDVWEVAFRADNPGLWANHCHNLPHAEQGMMLHLSYQ